MAFSISGHQEVNASLRDVQRQSIAIRRIPKNERASCNLEWFLTQQQNTRGKTPQNASRLQTCQEGARNLLLSSQNMKRQSRQIFSRERGLEKGGRRPFFGGDYARSSGAMSPITGPSELGLTQRKLSRPFSSSKRTAPSNSRCTKRAEPTQSQLCRKLHQDLQEHAMQLIEARGDRTPIATKIKLTISTLKQSLQFQALAIKFWILIINLQYHDVKKLSQSFADRQVTQSYDALIHKEKEIQHTSLPVDLVIYERVIPLFMKALGAIGDPEFNPTPIPQNQDEQNRLIKRKQHQMLLIGKVHFDKFIVDLGLMLGRNLVNLSSSDVAYIYRKCYMAMTHRFYDDMHFISPHQIQSPFQLNEVLQAQRNAEAPNPVIIPSSINNDNEIGQPRASRVQIMQTNEQGAGRLSRVSGTQMNTHTRGSFTTQLRKDPLSSKTGSVPGSDREEQRHRSFTNLTVSQGFNKQSEKENDKSADVLPPPPHFEKQELMPGPMPLQMNRLRTSPMGQANRSRSRTNSMPKKKDKQGDLATADSRSSASGSRRQKIQVPKDKALQPQGTDDKERGGSSDGRITDRKHSARSEHMAVAENHDDAARVLTSFEIVTPNATNPSGTLFDFENLHHARQNFKNELAAKIAYTQARVHKLVPFETLFTRKSCVEYLADANEFLADQELRVKKTPAGFARPKRKDDKDKRVILSRHGKRRTDENASSTKQQDPYTKSGTRRLDSLDNENIDIKPVTRAYEQNATQKMELSEIRDANETQMLSAAQPSEMAKVSQTVTNAQRDVAKVAAAEASLQSHESSAVSSQRPPVVHVTKHGQNIDRELLRDEGYMRHRLQQQAEEVFASSVGTSSAGVASDPSFAKDMRMHNSMVDQFRDTTPNYHLRKDQNKLAQMTNRLMQESVLDSIFKSHMLARAKKRSGTEADESRQFMAVVSKIDQEALIQSSNRMRVGDAMHEISFIQEMSQEQPPTHATTSLEDSNYQTADPPMPMFNQDLPADVLDRNSMYPVEVGSLNELAQSSPGGQIMLTPSKASPQKEYISTLQKSKVDTSSAKQQLGVRRRVFGMSNNKKLSPVYNRTDVNMPSNRSPILVTSLEKSDIDGMEGKEPGSAVHCKAHARSGREESSSRSPVRIAATGGNKQQTRIVPLTTEPDEAASPFAAARKSDVTANLSANGDREAESDDDSHLQNIPPVQQQQEHKPVPQTRQVKVPRLMGTAGMGDYAEQPKGVQSAIHAVHQKFASTKNVVTNAKVVIRPQGIMGSSNYHTSTSREHNSVGDRYQSTQDNQTRSKASIGVGLNQSELDFDERVVNIQVGQSLSKQNKRGRSTSQISSVISVSKKAKNKVQSRDKRIQNLIKKQQKVFPFSNNIAANKRSSSRNTDGGSRYASQSTFGDEPEKGNRKLQDGLFALRRANQHRRTQLHQATHERKERIVNSMIPGVDYTRQFDHLSAALGQIYDSHGNLLTPIAAGQMIEHNAGSATLLIPEELIKKMRQPGFAGFDSRNSPTQHQHGRQKSTENKDIFNVNGENVNNYVANNFQLSAIPSSAGGSSYRQNVLENHALEVSPIRMPQLQSTSKLNSQIVTNTQAYSPGENSSRGGHDIGSPSDDKMTASQDAFSNNRLVSKLLSSHTQPSHNSTMQRDIVVRGLKHQESGRSQNPYQMVIRQQASMQLEKGKSGDVSTMLDQTSNGGQIRFNQTYAAGNLASGLKLAQVDDCDYRLEDERDGTTSMSKTQARQSVVGVAGFKTPKTALDLMRAKNSSRPGSEEQEQRVLADDDSLHEDSQRVRIARQQTMKMEPQGKKIFE